MLARSEGVWRGSGPELDRGRSPAGARTAGYTHQTFPGKAWRYEYGFSVRHFPRVFNSPGEARGEILFAPVLTFSLLIEFLYLNEWSENISRAELSYL